MGELILVRHGETAWSLSGQHTGRTDIALTAAGENAARALAPMLARHHLVAVFSSPLSRAVRTAQLAGLVDVQTDDGLLEWDYGTYEGLTAAQIRHGRPGWDLWWDGVVDGEALGQIVARVDPLLGRVRPLLGDGDVALVTHGHLLRVLTARWLGLEAVAGRFFAHPGTATCSTLGLDGPDHDQPVISPWNVAPPG